MLQQIEENFLRLESLVQELSKKHQRIAQQLDAVKEEKAALEVKLEEEKQRTLALAEENKTIKLQAALSGNQEQNRLFKNHINRLIKEVDYCIATLQNKNL